MIEHMVFFLEEPSAQDLLQGLLPNILPDRASSIEHHFLVFQGKQDLEKNLVRRMSRWVRPNSKFVVLRDQDSGDCITIKRRLQEKCREAGHPTAVVRIACRELEAFFVGDWQAIALAFDKESLQTHANKAKYRNPDLLGSPSMEIKRLIPQYQKRDGARRIGPHLTTSRNKSNSFQALVRSLQQL
jgi:hypothetical protein